GSTATSSAKFGFLNVAGGTPTASISGTSNNALYLTGDGTLATTNGNSLTLGNSGASTSTGNILLNPNGTGAVGIGTTQPKTGATLDVTGIVDIDGATAGLNLYSRDNSGAFAQLYSNTGGDLQFYLSNQTRAYLSASGKFAIGQGNVNPLATLDVRATSIGGATIPVASISGATTNASLLVDQSGLGDIFTASKSGASKFSIGNDGTLKLYGGASGYVGIVAPSTIGSPYTLTLPNSTPGLAGQALVSDTNGNLSWTNVSTGVNPW